MLLLVGGLLYTLLIAALLAISKQNRNGWILYGVDAVGWIWYAVLLRQWTWIPFNVAFVAVAIYSWRSWK